jgi:hypothetical protein
VSDIYIHLYLIDMNSFNILNTICSYLNYEDLLQLAQTNKACNAAANRQELWKRECYRIFVDALELFDQPIVSDQVTRLYHTKFPSSEPIWKLLLKKGIQAADCIRSLSGDFLSRDQTEDFRNLFLEVLVQPSLPMPPLRREGRTFPTFLQDAIGQKIYRDSASDMPPMLGLNNDYLYDLIAQIDSQGVSIFNEVFFTAVC